MKVVRRSLILIEVKKKERMIRERKIGTSINIEKYVRNHEKK